MKIFKPVVVTIALLAFPVEGRTGGIKFEISPPSVRECDAPVVATVSWNADAAGVSTVKIFVSKEGGSEQLFANLGAQGNTLTEKWVVPNMVFILRDGTGSRELRRVVVGSTKC
jgi:hypothetical protein